MKHHQPNPNPLVERIIQAYLKTHMNEGQFEALVEEAIAEAAKSATSILPGQTYDQGFSDGYDSATKERYDEQ